MVYSDRLLVKITCQCYESTTEHKIGEKYIRNEFWKLVKYNKYSFTTLIVPEENFMLKKEIMLQLKLEGCKIETLKEKRKE